MEWNHKAKAVPQPARAVETQGNGGISPETALHQHMNFFSPAARKPPGSVAGCAARLVRSTCRSRVAGSLLGQQEQLPQGEQEEEQEPEEEEEEQDNNNNNNNNMNKNNTNAMPGTARGRLWGGSVRARRRLTPCAAASSSPTLGQPGGLFAPAAWRDPAAAPVGLAASSSLTWGPQGRGSVSTPLLKRVCVGGEEVDRRGV